MFEVIALNLSDDIYSEFKKALSRGRWSNGLPLTEKQRLTCQETILLREGANTVQMNSIH